jgi:hypothetical protein
MMEINRAMDMLKEMEVSARHLLSRCILTQDKKIWLQAEIVSSGLMVHLQQARKIINQLLEDARK